MNTISNASVSPLQAYAKQLQQLGASAQKKAQTQPTQKLEIQETALSERKESLSSHQELGEPQSGNTINLLA